MSGVCEPDLAQGRNFNRSGWVQVVLATDFGLWRGPCSKRAAHATGADGFFEVFRELHSVSVQP
jgi:hypothetical protein